MLTTSTGNHAIQHRDKIAFFLLALVQGTLIFTIAIILIPLPTIGKELGLGPADLLLVSAGYGLPYSGLLLFGGRLTDRYGAKKLFMLGLLIFGLASAIAAFTFSFETMVAMRFMQGVGAALSAPAAVAMLQLLFPEQEKFNKAMATWGGVSVFGAILGPLVSGVVTNWLSWRWMFVVPVGVSILGLIVTPNLLPHALMHRVNNRSALDLGGALFATLGISISSYGLISRGEHPWSSSIVLAPLLVGFIFLFIFFQIEKKARDPLLPPNFIKEPHRIAGLMGMLLAAAASALLMFLLSLFLQQHKGWTTLQTTGAYIPFAVALVTTNAFAGSLVVRFGAGRITFSGLVIGAIGLILLASIHPDSSFFTGLLPGLVLLPIGMSFLFAGSAVLSTQNVPAHQMGLAGGVMNTAMELGPTVGLAVFMSVAATRSDVVVGYAWAFGAAAFVYLVMAVVTIFLVRRIG